MSVVARYSHLHLHRHHPYNRRFRGGAGYDEDWDPFGGRKQQLLDEYKSLGREGIQNKLIERTKQKVDAASKEQKEVAADTRSQREKFDSLFAPGNNTTADRRDANVAANYQQERDDAQRDILLGLATKDQIKRLYDQDHSGNVKSGVGGFFESLPTLLFDNDFVDGLRLGFGTVTGIGAPLVGKIPGAEEAAGILGEAGKYIQGDIDSADTVLRRQQDREGAPSDRAEQQLQNSYQFWDPEQGRQALFEHQQAQNESASEIQRAKQAQLDAERDERIRKKRGY